MTHVTLFLDVDGVVSPLPEAGDVLPWADFRRVPHGFHCLVSRSMADALAALPVRLVWLTTWEEMANEVIAPVLGWDRLEVVERKAHAEEPWWKLNAVEAHIKASDGGPFIWIDDDIAFEDQVRPSLESCPVRYLLISPESSVGITPEHIRAIGVWLGVARREPRERCPVCFVPPSRHVGTCLPPGSEPVKQRKPRAKKQGLGGLDTY